MTELDRRLQVGVCFPASLIEAIDCERGDVPRSRFLEALIRDQLAIREGEGVRRGRR
jgi:hypothetical protein